MTLSNFACHDAQQMARFRRFDRFTLDATARRRDADGSLIVRGRAARSGLQTYHNTDGSERIEFRAPDEVRRSAATYEGITVTDQHPAEFVTPANWNEVSRGHLQNVAAVEGEDGEVWLEGDLVVQHGDLIEKIEHGERKELSAGYYCDTDVTPGTYRDSPYHCAQVGVVGNHVAVIRDGEARAGSGARLMLDSKGSQVPPGAQGERRRTMAKIRINRVDHEVDDSLAQAIMADFAARDESLAAEARRATEATAKLDAQVGEIKRLEADLATARDPATLDARAAERSALLDRAAIVAGKRIESKGSPVQVMLEALQAGGEDVLATVDPAKRADAVYLDTFVAARFDAAVAARKDARSSVRPPIDTTKARSDSPIAAALERNREATDERRASMRKGATR